MPVIVQMGPDTFKVLSNEPRDQLVHASMDDYQRAVDQGQAKPWREPPALSYDRDYLASQAARHAAEINALPQGQPLYVASQRDRMAQGLSPDIPPEDLSLMPYGYSGGGGGYSGATGYGGRPLDTSGPRLDYSPSYGMQPALSSNRPYPLAPDVLATGPMSVGNPAPTNASTFAPRGQPEPGYAGMYPATIAQSPMAPPRQYQTYVGPMVGGYQPSTALTQPAGTQLREAGMPGAWQQASALYDRGLSPQDQAQIAQLRGYMQQPWR